MDFCHLHAHSDYSLLDGAAKVSRLVQRAVEYGMEALALTDHGNLFGAIDFYRTARKAGVKPILGMEAYIAPGSRHDRVRDPVAAYHVTLLAKDLTGYRNLLELATRAQLEGFYYYPRIDRELLRAHHEGLVTLSGCLKGEVSQSLLADNRRRAVETADWYKSVFGEDYFLEVMRNGVPEQEAVNRGLLEISRELRIPLAATNDVHYIERDDALAHEVLLCLHTGRTLEDRDRMRMSSRDFYFRSPAEMWEIFRDMPEAADNTNLVASRIGLELDFGTHHLPRFDPPDGSKPADFFRRLLEEGIRKRYPEVTEQVRERLRVETEIIEKMGFVSYFLIVWDFIRFARENSIPVGPGRGSAAGSIVAYALGITDVDPLLHGLLFERFLNSERISMPDIDIDFCRDGREKVIRYVTEKYGGSEHVSQIITFGTMAARAVIRDVGRVLGIPLPRVDMIAKKIPGAAGTRLGESIEHDPDLKELRDKDPEVRHLFDIALRLEGLKRHASTHAAGVVIGDRPLTNYVPLYRNKEEVTTQYTMEDLERIGLLKMDFLGLKTLTVIDHAVKLIERTTGRRIDPRKDIPGDDEKTWRMLSRGDALGVFQLESQGMRQLLRQMRPDCFEDLVAILALYRPGPLETGMVDSFVRRKHGLEKVVYPHEIVAPILKDTYGTLVYQEQIMLISNRMGGLTLNQADALRKAMGKKRIEAMAPYRKIFIEGAEQRGVDRGTAETIWKQMEHFAKYCFNKSHTTAYAMVSWETAWLKANHPVEFMAALMTCDMGNTDKVVRYKGECRKMGIPIRRPDVSRSDAGFTVEEGEIRFGLGAVKGVGLQAIESLVRAREEAGGRFRSLFDFCERVDLRLVNRATIEALIKAGCFDSLQARRAQLMEGLGGAIKAGSRAQHDRDAGQLGLFGGPTREEESAGQGLPDVPEWPETQMLAFEKETLGFYLTSHPLAAHEEVLRAFSTTTTAALREATEGSKVILGCMFTEVKETYPRSGRFKDKKMALFRAEDFEGAIRGVIFSDRYERYGEHVTPDRIVFLEGVLDRSRDTPSLKVDRVIPVERAFQHLAGSVTIRIPESGGSATIETLKGLLGRHRGRCPVYCEYSPLPTVRTVWALPQTMLASATPAFVEEVEGLLGPGTVRFSRSSLPPGNGKGLQPANGDGLRGGGPVS